MDTVMVFSASTVRVYLGRRGVCDFTATALIARRSST